MRLVLVLLLLNSVANPAVPPGLITFNDDGAWNWFQDERAIAVGGKLIVASIAAGGEVSDPVGDGIAAVMPVETPEAQQRRNDMISVNSSNG